MNGCSIRRVGALAALGWMASVVAVTGGVLAIENLKVGESFPDFALRPADGAAVYAASRITGKPAVVVFWRPGQRLSLEALRDLKAISGEIDNERIGIVAVDGARLTDTEIQAAAGEALPFPLLRDPKRVLYGAVGVIVSPTTLVLDAKGVLRFILASHPRTFRQVISARLRFLLGEIDQQEMDREVEPTVLKIDQDLAAAWRMYNLGRRLQAEGKSDQALSVFEDAASRYPSVAEVRCALGFMKLAEGDLTEAAGHFQAALAHHPTSPLGRLGKAVVLARTGAADQAEPILLSLLGEQSVAARVGYELGRIYQSRGQLERAVAFYRNALTVLFPEPRGIEAPRELAANGIQGASPPASPSAAEVFREDASPGATTLPSGSAATVTTRPPAAGPTPAAWPDVTPVVPPADAKYLGIMGCKKCHYQQWKSWQDTKMASAFDLLKPGARPDAKQARSLDPQKDYTTDATCLSCHTTGYGLTGGYPKNPTGVAARSIKYLTGVGCEACHGPGSSYTLIHKNVQDKRRKYSQQEFFKAGQYPLDERVCAACHNPKGPCIDPGKGFDFAQRKAEGTHKHYSLQFRS